MDSVKVSVIIPTFNRARTIEKSVKSVLCQTYSNLEVIIVDDGSTDNTRELIESLNDSRIKYIYQENAGACAARNRGVCNATGEYIAFHDSDDVWHKDKIEKQLECFEKSNADIVFCKMNQIGVNKVRVIPEGIEGGIVKQPNNLSEIGTQTIIAKRRVFADYRFDQDMPRFQELEWLIRVASKYTLYCLSEGLVDYYVGNDSISRNSEKLYKACALIDNKNPNLRKTYPETGYFLARALVHQAYKSNNKKKYFQLACQFSHSYKILIKCLLVSFDINPRR